VIRKSKDGRTKSTMICKHKNTHILDSRKKDDVVVRRRACKDCSKRWTTAEFEIDNSVYGQPIFFAIEDRIMNSYFDRIAH